MARSQGHTAVYTDGMLTITLPDSIGVQRFDASVGIYRQQLRERASMPDGLRALIARLFEAGAITHCRITFGTKMELSLSRKSPNGRALLSGGMFKRFQAAFAQITGQQIPATWAASSGSSPEQRRVRRANFSSTLGVFRQILDDICDGVIFVGALDQLLDD